jgi:glyoxylase-like metal-dependent hydrolase (beta-lactamase superfamily II)
MTARAGHAAQRGPVEVATGVYQLAVSVPFAVGTVNAYLLDGDPLTLIDGGPNLGTSLVELERLVRVIGHELADIELLIVTHQHFDHEGLTAILAERADAEVASLDSVADYLAALADNQRADDEFAQALMLRHGIDPHVVEALGSVAAFLVAFGTPVTVTRRLAPGDFVEAGGRRLRTLLRPGHTPRDTVFHDEAAGVLFCGDHLLSGISSNALVTGEVRDGALIRTRPLIDYRQSLIATAELDVKVALGGHGDPIADHRSLIAQRLEGQQRKAASLLALLQARPLSAHELATAMYGPVAITQAFLTLSEVLGHLDLLIESGTVACDENADGIRFHTT